MPGEDSEEGEEGWGPKSPQEFFIKYAWLLVFIFLWLIFRAKQPLNQYGLYDIGMIGIFLVWMFGNLSWVAMKYHTPQGVCDPIHFSTFGYATQYGIYSCFTMGDVDALAWKVRGKEGTIVVPTCMVRARGRNVDIAVPVEKIRPSQLPYAYRHQIILNKNLPAPYWRGYIPTKLLEKNPRIAYLKDENQQLTETNAFLIDQIEGRGIVIEGLAKRKSRLERLKEKMASKPREEEY